MSSMTAMNIKSFMSVAPRLPADTSILIRGDHGIGKSRLARTLAKMLKERDPSLKSAAFPVIDRRLSQVSEGDIIGLPSTDGEVTRFNPPDWYKKACTEPCFLLLDELNRATHEVMQAAFQIVLDRELNGWKLHPRTRVMSAINSSAAYNVNEVDPALLDRFWTIDLCPDVQDWLSWGRERNEEKSYGTNVLSCIVDFIASENKFLDPPKNSEPGSVQVSRRSWERLSDALAEAEIVDEPGNELFYLVSMGFVGVQAAIALVAFAKTIDNRFSGKDIINNYPKFQAKILNKAQAEIFNNAIEKVADEIAKMSAITETQGKNLKTFMKDLPAELRVSMWTKLTSSGIDKLELAKTLHFYLAEDVLGVFGVPMGEAGIGVIPNIPGLFKSQPAK